MKQQKQKNKDDKFDRKAYWTMKRMGKAKLKKGKKKHKK